MKEKKATYVVVGVRFKIATRAWFGSVFLPRRAPKELVVAANECLTSEDRVIEL
jgi:hypothetical protein